MVQLEHIQGIEISRDVKGSSLTSMGTGGGVDYVVKFLTDQGVKDVVAWAKEKALPLYRLGGGTNVLISDRGLEGILLMPGGQFADKNGIKVSDGILSVPAGLHMGFVVNYVRKTLNSTALDFLAGVPGSVGGAVAVNAGMKEKAICDLVRGIRLISFDGRELYLDYTDISWGYRYCDVIEKGVVLLVDLYVKANDRSNEGLYERILNYRKETQPHGVRSAGSFFKNPDPKNGPFAGALIDKAGLKGFRHNDAMISPVHANFIVNLGKATTEDVLYVAEYAARRVYEMFGVRLYPEVRFLGEDMQWIW